MEKIEKILESFKTPHLYRDIIMTIGGFGFLVFFYLQFNNLKFHNDLVAYFKNIYFPIFTSWERDFIFLIISYIVGRTLVMVSEVVEIIYFNLVRYIFELFTDHKQYKTLFIVFKQRVQKWVEYKCTYRFQSKTISSDDLENVVISAEVALTKDKYKKLNEDSERISFHLIFSRIFFSTFLLSTFFISKYYILPCIISFVLFVRYFEEWVRYEHCFFAAAVKDKEHKV